MRFLFGLTGVSMFGIGIGIWNTDAIGMGLIILIEAAFGSG